jgi:hypothetical protein
MHAANTPGIGQLIHGFVTGVRKFAHRLFAAEQLEWGLLAHGIPFYTCYRVNFGASITCSIPANPMVLPGFANASMATVVTSVGIMPPA